MAQIPVYQQEVQPETEQPFRQNIQADPADFGANIGAATHNLGEEGVNLATQVMRQINYATVTKARLGFETAVDQTAQSQWYTKKNADAAGLPDIAQKYITDTRAQMTDGMNGRQKLMFDMETARYTRNVLNGVDAHTRQQQFNDANTTTEQAQHAAQSGAASNFTDENQVDTFRQNNEKAISAHLSLHGIAPDTDAGSTYTLTSRTKFNMAVVQAHLNSGDSQGALDYYQKYDKPDQIDPVYHDSPILKTLTADARNQQADQLAEKYSSDKRFTGGVPPGSTTAPAPSPNPLSVISGKPAQAPIDPVATPAIQRVPSDWGGMITQATQDISDPKLAQDVTQRLKTKEAAQAQSFKALDVAGRANENQWLAQNPDKTRLDITPAMANQFGLGINDQLELRNLHSSIAENAAKRADTEADKKQKLEDGIKAGNDVRNQFVTYNPAADKDGLQARAINNDIARVQQLDPETAKQVSKEFAEKIQPNKALDPEANKFLKWEGTGSKPGGLQAQILEDVQNANLASRDGYFFKGPGALQAAAPVVASDVKQQGATPSKSASYPLEVYQYASTLSKQVEAMAVKNKWSVADIQEHYKTDPELTKLRTIPLMKKWAAQVASGGGTGLPTAKVAPKDLSGSN